MVPKQNGFNQSEVACDLCARFVCRFACSPPMARDGEVILRQHFSSRRHNLPSKVRLRNNQTAWNVYMWMQISAGSIPDSYDIYRYLNLVRYSIFDTFVINLSKIYMPNVQLSR